MDREFIDLAMVMFMMVVGQMELGMDREFIDLLVVMFMMVLGQMDLDMTTESTCGQMEESMRGIGLMEKWKGKDRSFRHQEISMKVNSLRIVVMVTGPKHGLMEVSTLEIG
jgi:hypothetical protein